MGGHSKLNDEYGAAHVTPTNSEANTPKAGAAEGAVHGAAVVKGDGKSGISGAVFNLANAVSGVGVWGCGCLCIVSGLR